MEYFNEFEDACFDKEFSSSDSENETKTKRPLVIVKSSNCDYVPNFTVLGDGKPRKSHCLFAKNQEPVEAAEQVMQELELAFSPSCSQFTLPCKFGEECLLKKSGCTYAHNPNELILTNCIKHDTLLFPRECSYFHPCAETIDFYFDRVLKKTKTLKNEMNSFAFTRMCQFGQKCNKKHCLFAHKTNELRFLPCPKAECRYRETNCMFIHDDETHADVLTRYQNVREKTLVEALHKYKIEYRDDSKLCKKYIEGDLDNNWGLEAIIQRMCQMKFLFEYTPFTTEYKKLKENNTNITFDEAERIVMIQTVGSYRYPPGLWPWLV